MKTKINKIYKTIALISYCLLGIGFASCNDTWNEHYEGATDGGISLWEAITANSDLSNFARVAQSAGYDHILSSDQTYTVFAPSNASFTSQEAEALITSYNEQAARGVRNDENTVIRRFLKNHIALYRHPVSSITDETLTLMNSKYAHISATEISGLSLTSKNIGCRNGQLFTISSKLDYVPNVFEALDMTEGLDSVYQFLASHNTYEFQEAESVPGEIIDGVTHYLDSVTYLRNDLMQKYGEISSEDSTYWFVVPTNDVWSELTAKYAPYFNYPNNVAGSDSMAYTNTRLAIIGGAFFSCTNNPDAAVSDSVRSTQAVTELLRSVLNIDKNYYVYQRPFDEGGIFAGTTTVECSNGRVFKAPTWNFAAENTFMQTVSVEAEAVSSQDTIVNAVSPLTTVEVVSSNQFYKQISMGGYVEVIPTNPSARVAVGFMIPNLLSDIKYNIYAVFVPATAGDPLATAETTKPLRVLSRVRQADQNGVISSPPFRYARNVDGTKVDEVLLQSNVRLNTCSWGLDNPVVRLELQSNTDGATLRIDRVIFRPAE